MQLSLVFKQKLARALDAPVRGATELQGGSIHTALRVLAGTKSFFVKTSARVPARMFEREAAGLAALSETGLMRVPRVIAWSDALPSPFLALEWVDTVPRTDLVSSRLGEALAELHRLPAPGWGYDDDNYIGTLPQSNRETATWATFYGERRLGVLASFGRRSGRLPEPLCAAVEAIAARLPEWLPEPAGGPSLLHGDLWSGNWLATPGDEPVVIDPAVYRGAREVELAFTELFGGFAPSFRDAYAATYPLEAGYEDRKPLYQLYPVLVHAILFGGAYVEDAATIVRRYVGR